MHKTTHMLSTGREITLIGARLFDVAAGTMDGQTARATVAADDEWKARTCLMLVQSTMKLRGQFVTYQVNEVLS